MASESGVCASEKISVSAGLTPERISVSYPTPEEQRESMKREIRDKMKSFRDKLDAVECKLLAEVDSLVDLQISERGELEAKLKTLKEGKANLEELRESNAVKCSIELAIKDLDRKIIDVGQGLNIFEEIESNWEMSYWEIEDICELSNVKITYSIYKSKVDPKWQIPYGYNPSQLISPNGIAIQETSDDIFVSDTEGKRIQVLSQTGEHIRLIDLTTNPIQILLMKNSNTYGVYKLNNRIVLAEINISTLARRNINCPIKTAVKFAFSTSGRFYTCSHVRSLVDSKWIVNRFSGVLDSDLSPSPVVKQKPVSMVKSEYSTTLMCPVVDITTKGKIVYLLVSNNDYLVMKFNSDFKLLRSICPSSLLGAPRAICIDNEGNVIIAGHEREGVVKSTSSLDSESSEETDTKILVFTPLGELIHEMTHTSENCVGLAVNSEFDIFVLNNDTSYPLSCL